MADRPLFPCAVVRRPPMAGSVAQPCRPAAAPLTSSSRRHEEERDYRSGGVPRRGGASGGAARCADLLVAPVVATGVLPPVLCSARDRDEHARGRSFLLGARLAGRAGDQLR